MSLGRKELAALILAGSSFPAVPSIADTEPAYPQRSITVVVGFPPGGASDLIARHLAAYMTEDLGKKVVVEYKTGAGGNIAASSVARAAPDGYTLFLAAQPNAIHKVMYPSIDYDFSRDLTAIGTLATLPMVMVTGRQSSINDLSDVIAAAKARPGQLSCASAGMGTAGHLLCEMFKRAAGIDLTHVPYRGGAPALSDLMAGRTDVQITLVPSAIALIKSGEVKPIVVMSHDRIAALPDVPAIEEYQLPGQGGGAWYVLMAPAATPPEVIARLNGSINTVLRNPTLRRVMEELVFTLPGASNTPAQADAFIVQEVDRWSAVLAGEHPDSPR